MPRQTGKGSHKRKEAAFERRATQHTDFIGQAAPERAEAELRKHEGKRLIRDAPDALREKARERLELLPEPAQKAIQLAQGAAELLFVPVRFGLGIVRELVRLPATVFRILRHREA